MVISKQFVGVFGVCRGSTNVFPTSRFGTYILHIDCCFDTWESMNVGTVRIDVYKSNWGESCLLDFEWFLIYKGPDFAQGGSEVDFWLYLNSLSWVGVALVDLLSSDLIEWRISGGTLSQWESCMLRDYKVTWIAFDMLPFSFSTVQLASR